jgi:hypothetical protein
MTIIIAAIVLHATCTDNFRELTSKVAVPKMRIASFFYKCKGRHADKAELGNSTRGDPRSNSEMPGIPKTTIRIVSHRHIELRSCKKLPMSTRELYRVVSLTMRLQRPAFLPQAFRSQPFDHVRF